MLHPKYKKHIDYCCCTGTVHCNYCKGQDKPPHLTVDKDFNTVFIEPINELENSMTPINKLDSQPGFIAATRRKGTYIVGSVDSSGLFSTATNPMPHYTATSARIECKRLATLYPGRLYIFLQLSGAELVPNTPVSI